MNEGKLIYLYKFNTLENNNEKEYERKYRSKGARTQTHI